ncbi:MAG: TetR/AcrR family transcriptional regulator [Nitrosomonas halophila]
MTANNDAMREAIIETAMVLAARSSWEALRLHEVAEQLAISLDDIRCCFREKDELIDAWFDRADSHMLREAESAGFLELAPAERVQHLIMAWLNALAVQRRVTRQMIASKLEIGHIHIQVPAIMRVSRTVQWIREAAHRDATFVWRALEESALTSIYLMTFFFWMRDESEDARYTRQFLQRHLSMLPWLAGSNQRAHHANGQAVSRPRQLPLQLD